MSLRHSEHFRLMGAYAARATDANDPEPRRYMVERLADCLTDLASRTDAACGSAPPPLRDNIGDTNLGAPITLQRVPAVLAGTSPHFIRA
jgi:hypothetical protein